VFSVEEAAAVLHISRGKAYELARLYLTTNGAEGLPVKAFGRCFRVPRAGLEELLGGELRSIPAPKKPAPAPVERRPAIEADSPAEPSEPPSPARPRPRRHRANDAQLSLFDLPTSATPDQRA
jgi:hypothetical protein